MAKYTIEDTTLTSIADAIRTQYDDDSPINPLDMAEAILGIEGGGGGDIPFGISYTTLASESQTLTFEHDLGRVPIFCAIFPTDASDIIGEVAYRFVGTMLLLNAIGFCATSNTKALRNVASTSNFTFSNTDEVIVLNNASATYKYATGIEYACVYW